MTDHLSPREIERDIEQQRAGLTHTIEDLQERFSLDGVVRQLTDQFRTHGGDIGTSVSRSVRDNPMALALTGVGLAWMIFGNNDRSRHVSHGFGRASHPRRQDWSQGADDRFGDRAPGASGHDSRPGMTRGIAGARAEPGWAHRYDDPYGNQDDEAGDSWADRARAAGSSASQRATEIGASASRRAAGLRQSGSARVQAARDGMADGSARARDRAAHLRQQFAEGTEQFGEEARQRVIAARERAYHARDAALDHARQSGRKASEMYEQQPLIAGALAVALGAAVAAALPRTRVEDRYLGEESDALMDEAERIFEQERDKATKVAKAAMDEAGDIVDEAKGAAQKAKADADRKAPADSAAQAAADKAGEAGQRVADAAKAEAKKQELGKTNV